MNEQEEDTRSGPDVALRYAHRSVLVLILACVGLAFSQRTGAEEPPPDRVLGSLGVGLALIAIVGRRLASSPVISRTVAAGLGLVSLAASASLGLLGPYLAHQLDAPETGLLFALAGFIFALRPPTPAPAQHRARG